MSAWREKEAPIHFEVSLSRYPDSPTRFHLTSCNIKAISTRISRNHFYKLIYYLPDINICKFFMNSGSIPRSFNANIAMCFRCMYSLFSVTFIFPIISVFKHRGAAFKHCIVCVNIWDLKRVNIIINNGSKTKGVNDILKVSTNTYIKKSSRFFTFYVNSILLFPLDHFLYFVSYLTPFLLPAPPFKVTPSSSPPS